MRGRLAAAALLAAGLGWALAGALAPPELPAGLAGRLVFVSDRSGRDALYERRLPDGADRRLTWLAEPVADPAISPDSARVAFAALGRIGTLELATGAVSIRTLGVDWLDAQPAWRPDGGALVVVSRAGAGERADLHLLDLGAGVLAARRPLTETPGFDESDPVFAPDGEAVLFVRQGGLHSLELATGAVRRLTTGLRELRAPRFLPGGEIACLWREEKRFGIGLVDRRGKWLRAVYEGPVEYRSLAPAPGGRHLAASTALDLGFRLGDALRPRPTEEIHLLDLESGAVTRLARSWRFSNHSTDWGR